jgi:hypothetical protein
MGMQLKRGREESQEPQGPEGGGFLEGLASTWWGMLLLLFVLVVLMWACFAGALAGTGNPPF